MLTAQWSQLIPFQAPYQDASQLFTDFINTVNSNRMSVLEIGSRIVSPGSVSKRPMFPGASSYTGFDFHADGNTDIVGDAHKLSTYLGGKRFDAVFSISVFEHLAMPWVAALEINKALTVGGITFHSTHFAWPAHDQPWDYWRFSDEALKGLFSRPMGYQVVGSGMFAPLRMYADTVTPGLEGLPYNAGFGGSAILAKKVGEIDAGRFKWDVSIDEMFGSESQYPLPAK